MKNILLSICLLLVLAVIYSCGNETNDFLRVAEQNGVQVHIIKNKPKKSNEFCTITETLSLGGEEPVPKLFQPRNCLVDNAGNLYFSDEGRIKKFSPKGEFMHFIGNKGEGPGEINFPSLEQIIGDSLIVGQTRRSSASRYEIFSLNGDSYKRIYYPRVERKLFPEASNYVKRYVGSGVFIFYSRKMEPRENGIIYMTNKFGLANMNGKFLQELEFDSQEYISNIRGDGVGMSQPLSMGTTVFYYQNIYILSFDGTTIYKYNKSGELKKIIKLDFKGPKISSEEKDKNLYKEDDPRFKKLARLVGTPERRPAVCDIVVDDQNRLWLKKGDIYGISASEISEYVYWIVNDRGEYIAEQKLPIDLKMVKNNQAFGFETDEDYLRIFKRFSLIEN
jgi:hypothetical protein